MRRILSVAAIVVAVIALYTVSYIFVTWRDNGYARHAGEFYHYRYVSHAWEYYLFIPAAYIESRIIWLRPLPFLPHPSWASEPQVLIYKDAGEHMKRFRASEVQLRPSI
jgi:hypothetical protein